MSKSPTFQAFPLKFGHNFRLFLDFSVGDFFDRDVESELNQHKPIEHGLQAIYHKIPRSDPKGR